MKGKNRFAFTMFAVLVVICTAQATLLDLKTDRTSCRIETNGARILSFAVGDEELLWNADPIQLTAHDWAHGGIPTCWRTFTGKRNASCR